MTTSTPTYTAWITTSDYPDADPGLSVQVDGEGTTIAEIDADLAEDGGIDKAHADRLLSELGYARTGEWTGSGDQWAAKVEPA